MRERVGFASGVPWLHVGLSIGLPGRLYAAMGPLYWWIVVASGKHRPMD